MRRVDVREAGTEITTDPPEKHGHDKKNLASYYDTVIHARNATRIFRSANHIALLKESQTSRLMFIEHGNTLE